MRKRMKTLLAVTIAQGGVMAIKLRDVVYNLPMLLAFDVLRQVLLAAHKEGQFRCRRRQLGDLMDSAKTTLTWKDWDELRAGVRRRNEIAHEGKLFDNTECLKDIMNVQEQLVAWGIINAA